MRLVRGLLSLSAKRPSCLPHSARVLPLVGHRIPENTANSRSSVFCHSGSERYSHESAYQHVLEPTIYALSTAPGRAAIAVIRISGPACETIYQGLCPGKKQLKPRHAAVRTLYRPGESPSPDSVLDPSALLLYFPNPRTVTGEDVLELHVHGGTAVVRAVLSAIPQCSNIAGSIRYAEPGEFTRRAFMNDRLDLTQVEALGDTLSAATEQQRRLSVRGTTNKLALRYESWRKLLLAARGELEALIDFSEDQHFDESPAELASSVAEQVRNLRILIDTHSRNAMRGELLRNGIAISLLGAPNAGKSSLLNRVVGREAAIVSQEAGTTRDVVEVGIDLGGYLCRLGDTAGLRSAPLNTLEDQSLHMREKIGLIEKEGMRRAKERAATSDVVIVVLSFEQKSGNVFLNLDPEVMSTTATLSTSNPNILIVLNKTDLLPTPEALPSAQQQISEALPYIDPINIFPISCKEAETSTSPNAGQISTFLTGLTTQFASMTSALSANSEADASIWQESLGASERHRLLLDECSSYLQEFVTQVTVSNDGDAEDIDIVLAAESLRVAATCLAKITGKGEAGDVEEVLGVVFEKFCVGK